MIVYENDYIRINVDNIFDITEQKPYGINISISFMNLEFKERVTKKVKENDIGFVTYSYDTKFQIFMRKLFKLGYMDIDLEKRCGRDTNLLDDFFEPNVKQYTYDSKEKQEEAQFKITTKIKHFLIKEYEDYINLQKELSKWTT